MLCALYGKGKRRQRNMGIAGGTSAQALMHSEGMEIRAEHLA